MVPRISFKGSENRLYTRSRECRGVPPNCVGSTTVKDKAEKEEEEVVAPGDSSVTIDSTCGISIPPATNRPTDRPTDRPAGRPYYYRSRGCVARKEIKEFSSGEQERANERTSERAASLDEKRALSLFPITRCGKPSRSGSIMFTGKTPAPSAPQCETRGEGFIEAGYVISGSTTGVYRVLSLSPLSSLPVYPALLIVRKCVRDVRVNILRK